MKKIKADKIYIKKTYYYIYNKNIFKIIKIKYMKNINK